MSKSYRVIYLPIAEKDITEILEYIQTDNPAAAINLLDQFDKAVTKLAYFPFMGQGPKDIGLQKMNYRVLVINNYLIFYVVNEDTVEIRIILHGKRKYSFLL